MDEADIKLDRYAKFRKIGQYEEFLVSGGKYREAKKARTEVILSPPCSSTNFHSTCFLSGTSEGISCILSCRQAVISFLHRKLGHLNLMICNTDLHCYWYVRDLMDIMA